MSTPARGLARVPLRTQFVALLLGAVTLVVLATSVAGQLALRNYLVGRIDAQLTASLSEVVDGQHRGRRPPGRRGDVAVRILRFDSAGGLSTSRVRPGSFDDGPRITNVAELGTRPTDVPGTDGGSWRVLAAGLGDGGTVVAAVSRDGVEATSGRLLFINAAVGLVTLLLGGALAVPAVRRSLAPLVAVEQTAEAIALGDLTRRVPAGDPRTEVGSLAASFNAMVDRFESAYGAQQQSEAQARASEERMRRFVGDASHELRTPLTSIRGFAELFRQGAASEPAQLQRVMRRIEDEATRMGVLVEDLLLLARLDQQRPLARDRVDLLAVAADAVHDAATVHPEHLLELAAQTDSAVPIVTGDDVRLRQVVGNLVTNAVTHTPAGTHVRVGVRADGDEVVLSVTDDGPGMPADVAARVFERFYRADPARSRSAPQASGSGLGLSIVAALVTAHGGQVGVVSAPGTGTTFTVILPAAQ